MKKLSYLVLTLIITTIFLTAFSACEKSWKNKYIIIESEDSVKVTYKTIYNDSYFYDVKIDDKRICYVFGNDYNDKGLLISREDSKDFKGYAKFYVGVPECTTENLVVKFNGNVIKAESVTFSDRYVFVGSSYYMPIYTYYVEGEFNGDSTISISGLNPTSKRDAILYFSYINENKYYAVKDGNDIVKICLENVEKLNQLGYNFYFSNNDDYIASLTYPLYTNMQEVYFISNESYSPRAYIHFNNINDRFSQRLTAYSEGIAPSFSQLLYEEEELPNDIYSYRIFGEIIYSLYFC